MFARSRVLSNLEKYIDAAVLFAIRQVMLQIPVAEIPEIPVPETPEIPETQQFQRAQRFQKLQRRQKLQSFDQDRRPQRPQEVQRPREFQRRQEIQRLQKVQSYHRQRQHSWLAIRGELQSERWSIGWHRGRSSRMEVEHGVASREIVWVSGGAWGDAEGDHPGER